MKHKSDQRDEGGPSRSPSGERLLASALGEDHQKKKREGEDRQHRGRLSMDRSWRIQLETFNFV